MKEINYAAMFTKRSDGRYMGYIKENGKRRAIYDKDPEKLFNKIRSLENPEPPSFEKVAKAWRNKHWEKIAYKTKSCYESRYKDAVYVNEGKLITEVSAADIDRHLRQLAAKGYSSKTVKTQRTVYNLIFNFAIISEEDWLKGFVSVNPVSAVSIPRGLPKAVREAPEDDVIEIVRQSYNCYFGLFPFLLLYTGLRKGEALALTWGDINYEKKIITINKSLSFVGGMPKIKIPKTEKGYREIPILPDLETVLKKPKGVKSNDPVFQKETGGYFAQKTYDRRWKHYCKEAGLVEIEKEIRKDKNGRTYTYKNYKPIITAHQLRHGYATILFEAGVDEYTAQYLLGHADIKTTRSIYTHLREKQKLKSVDKLHNYIKNTYKPI